MPEDISVLENQCTDACVSKAIGSLRFVMTCIEKFHPCIACLWFYITQEGFHCLKSSRKTKKRLLSSHLLVFTNSMSCHFIWSMQCSCNVSANDGRSLWSPFLQQSNEPRYQSHRDIQPHSSSRLSRTPSLFSNKGKRIKKKLDKIEAINRGYMRTGRRCDVWSICFVLREENCEKIHLICKN